MAAGDVADGVRHREQGETERERHAEQPDPDVRERGCEHRAPASAEDQPEGSEQLRRSALVQRHAYPSLEGGCCADLHVETMRKRAGVERGR